MPEDSDLEGGYRPGLVEGASDRLIVLSGCSGAGKSALLAGLERRGFAVFEEPGRQIVKEQLYIGSGVLPWQEPVKFVDLAVSRSMHHMIVAAKTGRMSFFDRGIIDAVGFLEHLRLPVPQHLENALRRFRYHGKVFMTPPWREIFRNDAERQHSFEDAVAAYDSLLVTYRRLGYDIVDLPRLGVEARVDFILEQDDRLK
jgi:predicted ATPase